MTATAWEHGETVTVKATYPYKVDLLGFVVASGQPQVRDNGACGMNRLRRETGQAAVLSVIFMAALLGAVAMVLDVGSWFREQRATQSAADAAALAAAQALPESTGTSSALAAQYLGSNGGGAGEFSFSSRNLANDTIIVKVTRAADGVFAKIFGIDSVKVHAKASARSGNPTARATPRRSRSTRRIRCSIATRCRASTRRRRSTSRRPGRAHSGCSTSTARTEARAARSITTGS